MAVDRLQVLPWVRLGGTPLAYKFTVMGQTEYVFLVTDSKRVWREALGGAALQARGLAANPGTDGFELRARLELVARALERCGDGGAVVRHMGRERLVVEVVTVLPVVELRYVHEFQCVCGVEESEALLSVHLTLPAAAMLADASERVTKLERIVRRQEAILEQYRERGQSLPCDRPLTVEERTAHPPLPSKGMEAVAGFVMDGAARYLSGDRYEAVMRALVGAPARRDESGAVAAELSGAHIPLHCGTGTRMEARGEVESNAATASCNVLDGGQRGGCKRAASDAAGGAGYVLLCMCMCVMPNYYIWFPRRRMPLLTHVRLRTQIRSCCTSSLGDYEPRGSVLEEDEGLQRKKRRQQCRKSLF